MSQTATTSFNEDCAALAANPAHADVLQVRVATCPKCKGWVYQGAYPHCNTSKEAQKELRACMAAGMDIATVTLTEARKLNYCDCPR